MIFLNFYQIKNNELQNEICNIFNSEAINIQKLELIRYTLLQKLSLLKNVYRMLLNYIERPDCFDVDYQIVFEKEKPFFIRVWNC